MQQAAALKQLQPKKFSRFVHVLAAEVKSLACSLKKNATLYCSPCVVSSEGYDVLTAALRLD